MNDPSNFVNWSDYLGVNQESADAQVKKLMDPLNKQAGQLGDQQNNFAGYAQSRGRTEGETAFGGAAAQQGYENSLMSYGDAVERLRDPAARQAVMQKQFGSANAIDSALVGAAGGGQLAQLEQNKQGVFRGDESMRSDVAQRFALGRSELGARQEGDARYKASQQAQYDQRQKGDVQAAQARQDRLTMAYAKHYDSHWDPYHDTATRSGPFGVFDFSSANPDQYRAAMDNQKKGMDAYAKSSGKTFGIDNTGEGYWY